MAQRRPTGGTGSGRSRASSRTTSVLAFVAIAIVGLAAAALLAARIRRMVSAGDGHEEAQPDAAGPTGSGG
jgi:HAMP domain-containing protein